MKERAGQQEGQGATDDPKTPQGNSARHENPVTSPDCGRITSKRRRHALRRREAHTLPAVVDTNKVDLYYGVFHEQLANAHPGRSRSRLVDELVSCVEIWRYRNARPG